MNISATILVICSLFVYAHAHVVLSDWEIVADDVICPRPATGPCSKAGACCNQREGTQRLTRTCEEDHCGDAPLSMTRTCRINCNDVDKGSWGSWTASGNCRRPAEGPCSSPGSCCSELEGTMTLTTTCESDKGCLESKLTKDVKCNIRCGGFTQYKRAGNCVRPSEGRCSGADTCCGERKGTMKFVRECLVAGECDASRLERTRGCNLRCGVVHPCDLYPNPCANGGTCVKDGHSHSCSCPSGWKGHHCETVAPINGGFTEWSEWSDCDASCGDGQQTKSRTCTNPEPANDGDDCIGEKTKVQSCSSGVECPDQCVTKGVADLIASDITEMRALVASSIHSDCTSRANWFIDAPGSWCAAANAADQYVGFGFAKDTLVRGIVTQGRYGGNQWVTAYYVMYYVNGEWNDIFDGDEAKEFAGNVDSDSKVRHLFEEKLLAEEIRIIPIRWVNWPSMRFEILYCDPEEEEGGEGEGGEEDVPVAGCGNVGPCQNGAKCIDMGFGTKMCDCTDGWSGAECRTPFK